MLATLYYVVTCTRREGRSCVGCNIGVKFDSAVCSVVSLRIGALPVDDCSTGSRVDSFFANFAHFGLGGRCVRARVDCGVDGCSVSFPTGR